LIELESRIVRLRTRLRNGDPDMTSDEIEAAITRAEAKRAELMAVEPDPKESARLLAALPNAAELYRRQIMLGLAGDPGATQKARLALRTLLGTIQLEQGDGHSVWAVYEVHPAALIAGAGSGYRGDRI
jgi:site-specific DNA recombinase